MDLGASPIRTFFDITLPIIAPALVSGWLLGFTLSLDDLVIASFVSGPGSSPLPMVIFSKLRLVVSPDVNALATIIIGIVALGDDADDDGGKGVDVWRHNEAEFGEDHHREGRGAGAGHEAGDDEVVEGEREAEEPARDQRRGDDGQGDVEEGADRGGA